MRRATRAASRRCGCCPSPCDMPTADACDARKAMHARVMQTHRHTHSHTCATCKSARTRSRYDRSHPNKRRQTQRREHRHTHKRKNKHKAEERHLSLTLSPAHTQTGTTHTHRTHRAGAGGRAVRTSFAAPSMWRATRAASRRGRYCPNACDAPTADACDARTQTQTHTHTHAHTHAQTERMARARAGGVHKLNSAVNVESDAGSVPEMRLLPKSLRHTNCRCVRGTQGDARM